MYSLINTSQIFFNILLACLFIIVALIYYRLSTHSSKLFAVGISMLAVIQILNLIINAQIFTSLIDYQFVSYLLYVSSIFLFLLSSVQMLKPSLKRPVQTVLILLFIVCIFALLISRLISSPTVYELVYVFSFNNPIYLNIFSLILSVSLVSSSIVVHTNIKDGKRAGVLELFFAILAFSISIGLVSSSLILKLTSSGIILASLIVIIILSATPIKTKLNKSSENK